MEIDWSVSRRKDRAMRRFVRFADQTYTLEGADDVFMDIDHLFGLFPMENKIDRQVIYCSEEQLNLHTELFMRVLQYSASSLDRLSNSPDLCGLRRVKIRPRPLAVLGVGKTVGTGESSAMLFCADQMDPIEALSDIKIGLNHYLKTLAKMN